MDLVSEEETPDQVLKAQAAAAWRALMSRIYSALAKKKIHTVLNMKSDSSCGKRFLLIVTPLFTTSSVILSNTLSIYGVENAQELNSNNSDGYPALSGTLDEYSFKYLVKLRSSPSKPQQDSGD